MNKSNDRIIDFRRNCTNIHSSFYINGADVEQVKIFRFPRSKITKNRHAHHTNWHEMYKRQDGYVLGDVYQSHFESKVQIPQISLQRNSSATSSDLNSNKVT